jgi:hypothetical protein
MANINAARTTILSSYRKSALENLSTGSVEIPVRDIPKNRCRTTIPERMVETLAELPFIGDQVVWSASGN